MRQTLYKRLHQLEEASARAHKQRDRPDEEAGKERFLKKVKLFLQLRGVERQGHESLAEALCRALEIDSMELRRLLRAGIDPIHKYFTDHGVFAEIERRKAAGTWPGG
jgi:hypothetical protein